MGLSIGVIETVWILSLLLIINGELVVIWFSFKCGEVIPANLVSGTFNKLLLEALTYNLTIHI